MFVVAIAVVVNVVIVIFTIGATRQDLERKDRKATRPAGL
jgi:hypothetical protein